MGTLRSEKALKAGGGSQTGSDRWGDYSAMTVDPAHKVVVGLEINANHIRPVRDGLVTARASAEAIGRTTQIWTIRITDEALLVTGSAGLSASSPLQRYFRDARTAIGQPPLEDVALTTIGKAALGLSSSAPSTSGSPR